ncbi:MULTISPECIES: hypothetical protein [Enterobacter]|uniref:hypothetical protein n=1 Tax=Enterobacter TaxID=547 RepID=UPI000C1F11E3|nr:MULTISPECIES: hypothetical protein [Enterobacter]MCL8098093.1 hypothetical protein [Enterobacter hormaechei]MCM8025440.1 hypothetical protein [Enterobacter hormaechei]MCM8043696.1 hypothetical protein [Enterobacter hormaechei]PJD87439.1 hypothetical protein B9Q35_11640 [Enterobacter hormaechei]UCT06303.1 hypothetical protein K6742_16235 [Enterobacter mori]
MPTPYETIDNYCKQNKKNNCVRDLAYSIYTQQNDLLSQDQTLTPAAIQKMLLTDASLVAHIRSAEDALSAQVESEISRIRKELGTKSFGISVLSGVTGNIVYSLLLVIIFVLAKDQISTWLSSLSANTP